jgi:hypothetical protein
MRYASIAAILIGLAGCGVETVATTAVQGAAEAQNAKTLIIQKGAATNLLDKTKIENAIQSYYTQNQAYPASLANLVPDYLPVLPVKSDGTQFRYDATTGKLLD